MNTEGILALSFYCDDLDRELTVRQYLKELLKTLWKEGEGFSGKRPFGNSGWEGDLGKPLIKYGVINGKLDEDGYIEHMDDKQYEKIILECIESL